ncbi:hypothetical protein SAMN06265379_101512 [Saccharicrinis carchari]|uniref:Uncharacterized protein n=1 Tax=Saccharicrinis carchari TaxID=1168039 RepID=A0A521AXU5_SACCC|nr:hypothetical protein SAMN06265379_101512 [Saccharicrinis carchari]
MTYTRFAFRSPSSVLQMRAASTLAVKSGLCASFNFNYHWPKKMRTRLLFVIIGLKYKRKAYLALKRGNKVTNSKQGLKTIRWEKNRYHKYRKPGAESKG